MIISKTYSQRVSLFIILFLTGLFLFAENDVANPDKNPVNVSVNIYFNRILNINTIDESYQIDGYMELSWYDESMKYEPIKRGEKSSMIYVNDQVTELINSGLWFPTCEMKNVQGKREINNMKIEIEPNGRLIYTERFYGTFSSNMDYKKFPFDKQKFNVVIESFSYDKTMLSFTDPKFFPLIKDSKNLLDTWEIDTILAKIEDVEYEEFSESAYQINAYSRVSFEIIAKRMAGYFIWQVFFPLMIIIFASFLVFWIKDFSTQIGIGFTLMLTVVAFNFYSASILPELPYNTFIETTIIIGYIFIFFSILAVVVNHRINLKRGKDEENKLLIISRYMFPAFYFLSMLLLYVKFYH